MSTITRQIETILNRRLGREEYAGKGRLQKIESKIDALKNIQEKMEHLDVLISSIAKEIEQKDGDYYRLLNAAPEALLKFNDVSCDSAKGKIKIVIDELESLKNRFSRKALRIAFIGRERQGKSTFLKTITGLTDKVIPAYSGNSCTGAVSVIHNIQGSLEVVVDYYTIEEFLSIVREKLSRFFPNKDFALRRLADIKELSLPDYPDKKSDISLMSEYNKFKDAYIKHYDEYSSLIGTGKNSYYNEDEIALHVAQYEEFPKSKENSVRVVKDDGEVVYRVNYYKYVAVKGVDIYTPFKVAETQMLELVDTIGIGGSADSFLVEEEMYRVLREDCDAAIDLFRPDKTANLPKEQTDLLDNIWEKLSERDPSKWIVYVINKATAGVFKNEASVKELMPIIDKILSGEKENQPVAWAKDVDGNNLKEVSELLINPLLNLITENLDDLDDALMTHAEELSKDAYNKCLSLVKAANAVTSASANMSADMLSLFDEELFKKLTKDFGYALNQLDELGYAKNREKQCEQLEREYEEILNDIDLYIPNEDVIFDRFMSGAALTQSQLFEEYVEQMRNDIFSAFENVNSTILTPLQERVKSELIDILYNQGRMKYLPVNSLDEGPTTKWLNEVIENYVDENTYPNLNKALKFILDYQINIEGLVEYNVTRGLYVIDRTHQEFIRYNGKYADNFEEKASDVWQELCNRILPVTKRMKAWIGDFTLIPSHSFYSRIHKFHVKVMTDQGGKEDFRRFYRKNMGIIWGDEIRAASKAEKAFGDWTDRVKSLQSEIIRDNFKMN